MPNDSVSVPLLVNFMHTVNVHRMKIPLLQTMTMYCWVMQTVTVVTAVAIKFCIGYSTKPVNIFESCIIILFSHF